VEPDPTQLLDRLRPHGQEHLLQFWDELSPAERKELTAQIESVDLAHVGKLHQEATAKSNTDAAPKDSAESSLAELAARAEPPPAVRLADQKTNLAQAERARKAGEQALSAGTVGVVLVAGGQGSRLGFEHPKGLFPIGPVSGATLFQILFQKILATQRKYGADVPLYLMTSPATHEETLAALDEVDRYGLSAKNVCVFCQGTMPTVDAATGRLLLEAKGKLFLSPDGHGGMLQALVRSGALLDMRRRGLTQLFYMQVDNPLAVVCDPSFIGYHLGSGSEVSTQVVAKHDPLERVGNVVSIDGRVQIIEYSDLPAETARQTLADGSLKLWAGNIAVHVFDVAFLERASGDRDSLPFHIARKAAPHVDPTGEVVTPEKPTAIKFERFIFDLMPAARHSLVYEVDQQATFAPVKNASGAKSDSPETVQAQMVALYKKWLSAAGAKVDEGVRVEISPLFALDAAGVAEKVKPGLRVNKAQYFE
jgi:UDP-N-acetylglucosamine/UDP-N-acetylgalactosamine diphosphorylase